MSRERIIFFAVLIPSVILHEISHGAVAYAFGDDTAKKAGRLSLNPIRHIDPFGTIILPAIMVITTGSAFGYARPVPVNVRRLRNPRNHGLLVSLVGPTVNIVLALVAAAALRFGLRNLRFDSIPVEIVFSLGLVNVILATFNLLPIPPLDGSALLERVMPKSWWPRYLTFRQYSMGIVLALVLLLPQVLGRVFDPAINLWFRLLG